MWKKVKIDMDAINDDGNLVHLKDVPAIEYAKGKFGVYPENVIKALKEQPNAPIVKKAT